MNAFRWTVLLLIPRTKWGLPDPAVKYASKPGSSPSTAAPMNKQSTKGVLRTGTGVAYRWGAMSAKADDSYFEPKNGSPAGPVHIPGEKVNQPPRRGMKFTGGFTQSLDYRPLPDGRRVPIRQSTETVIYQPAEKNK